MEILGILVPVGVTKGSSRGNDSGISIATSKESSTRCPPHRSTDAKSIQPSSWQLPFAIGTSDMRGYIARNPSTSQSPSFFSKVGMEFKFPTASVHWDSDSRRSDAYIRALKLSSCLGPSFDLGGKGDVEPLRKHFTRYLIDADLAIEACPLSIGGAISGSSLRISNRLSTDQQNPLLG